MIENHFERRKKEKWGLGVARRLSSSFHHPQQFSEVAPADRKAAFEGIDPWQSRYSSSKSKEVDGNQAES